MRESHDTPDAEPDESPEERDETAAQRLDRQWDELLQELRITQTGIQILSGFLLTLPFQARFGELELPLRILYLVAVALATVATICVVAAVAAHRRLFSTHRKDALIRLGNTLAKAGLALLALSVLAVTGVTFGFVVGLLAGVLAMIVAGAVFVALWLIVPSRLARRPPNNPYVPHDRPS